MSRQTPLWASVLGVLVQLAALGLCAWAMEEARGSRLPPGKPSGEAPAGSPPAS